MTISKNNYYSLLTLGLLIVTIMFYFDIDPYYSRSILSCIYLLLTPGIFILSLIKNTSFDFWYYISYGLGLSLTLVIFLSLIINSILPIIGINEPLTFGSAFSMLILMNFMLGIITYLKTSKTSLTINNINISKYEYLLLVLALLLPIISILGVKLLNNNGHSIISNFLIIFISLIIILITFLKNKINQVIYPVIILLIGLSLLFSYSLRSNYILGWDINQEFSVFQITKSNLFWSSTHSTSTYNSCLSITTLPTILSHLVSVNDQNIFKVIYPILFSIVPMNLYLLIKRHKTPFIAFLAAFFFMAQGIFYLEMPALARQEIAFILFITGVLVLFDKSLNNHSKNILFIFLWIGLILSHYSSAYIAIALLITTYTLSRIINIFKRKVINLRLYSVILLTFTTIIWNTTITGSYVNVRSTIYSTLKNFNNIFSLKDKNATVFSFLLNKEIPYTQTQLDTFVKLNTKIYAGNDKNVAILLNGKYDLNKLYLMNSKYIPDTKTTAQKFFAVPYTISKYIVLISLIAGVTYTLFRNIIQKDKQNLEYAFFSVMCTLMIVTLIVLPVVSVAYDVDRLFQQSLVFTTSSIITGFLLLFKKHIKIGNFTLTCIFIVYFIYQSGLTAPLTKNHLRINTSNSGLEYDAFYVNHEDIVSLRWVENNVDKDIKIFSDSMTSLKMTAFIDNYSNVIPYIIPNIIDRNSYVISSYSNGKNEIAFMEDQVNSPGALVTTNFPYEFLNENKNVVYSSGNSKIFK